VQLVLRRPRSLRSPRTLSSRLSPPSLQVPAGVVQCPRQDLHFRAGLALCFQPDPPQRPQHRRCWSTLADRAHRHLRLCLLLCLLPRNPLDL